jgi:hypothetical protein
LPLRLPAPDRCVSPPRGRSALEQLLGLSLEDWDYGAALLEDM